MSAEPDRIVNPDGWRAWQRRFKQEDWFRSFDPNAQYRIESPEDMNYPRYVNGVPWVRAKKVTTTGGGMAEQKEAWVPLEFAQTLLNAPRSRIT